MVGPAVRRLCSYQDNSTIYLIKRYIFKGRQNENTLCYIKHCSKGNECLGLG
jgi:hypothetical protein